MPEQKIMPRPSAVSEPFWQGAREGQLRLQQCNSCGHYQFYPRLMCSHCGAQDLAWQPASGRGRVASFTIVRRGISLAYTAPYVVALIDLEEGVRMMSQILIDNPGDGRLMVGADVRVLFADWADNVVVPVFELIDI
ncbi:MAG: Zn-ribbon domain-containing OB-fold protein [Pseudomonadota bacterium]